MDFQIWEAVVVILLIVAAGWLSAAEIAIGSFGKNRIDELKEKEDKSAKAFEALQKDPNAFFGTVQIVTNIFLLAAVVLTYHIISKVLLPFFSYSEIKIFHTYSFYITGIISLILVSFFTMIFGMLIPKAIGFKYADKIGKSSIKILLILTWLLKIPVKIVTEISNIILIPFKEKTNFHQTRLSEDEIRIIISESVETGALDETEQEIIENVFEFIDLRANEVMIPRTDMNAVELTGDDKEVIKEIIKTGNSIVPVYEESVDNIIGVIHTKDFIKYFVETFESHPSENIAVKNIIRPAYFIPETKLISEVLNEMQKRGERLAIVTDEYGGTEGVITIEDILEEIVGELGDSKSQQKEYSRLPDGKYYVLGSMSIYDFNETFNHELPESDEYNTIAGFIADKTGKILNVGETIKFNDLNFELIKKIRQKMVQFKIYSENGEFKESDIEK